MPWPFERLSATIDNSLPLRWIRYPLTNFIQVSLRDGPWRQNGITLWTLLWRWNQISFLGSYGQLLRILKTRTSLCLGFRCNEWECTQLCVDIRKMQINCNMKSTACVNGGKFLSFFNLRILTLFWKIPKHSASTFQKRHWFSSTKISRLMMLTNSYCFFWEL